MSNLLFHVLEKTSFTTFSYTRTGCYCSDIDAFDTAHCSGLFLFPSALGRDPPSGALTVSTGNRPVNGTKQKSSQRRHREQQQTHTSLEVIAQVRKARHHRAHSLKSSLDSLQWRKEGEGVAEIKSERQSFLCVIAREVVAFTSHC